MKVTPSQLKGDLPTSAPHEAVHAFNHNSISPPSLPNILLDWSCSLLTSSHWNSKSLALLSLSLYEKLKGGSYCDVTFCEQDMNLGALHKFCVTKYSELQNQNTNSRTLETWRLYLCSTAR
ncbi:hypothetical protein PAXRUDRAFT_148814 [Paxillus rubicundulus Ve08.2h10]|uniref:Uncharacterized protein n=1 Tax=Paxillus rubicundulus Ve08.2h10 TaxID=930991 RepID=A0A0D0DTA5_9AGAM|nr:hypothetical protein PAXRUDRAFT_148814 [Paxillus rubicundulus Ve08.2h10]